MGEGFDALKDLKWLAIIMAFMWVLWLFTGGPARYEASHGVLLKPPSPLSSGQTYGELPDVNVNLKVPKTLNVFLSGKNAVLGARTSVKGTNPNSEYLEIVGESDTSINITGWKIVGKKGTSAIIPQGARLFKSGEVNELQDIYLAKGVRAIIISGNSPVGVSFRVNSCSGYLAQFQSFIPKLNNVCPIPDASMLGNSCKEYVDSIPVCTTPVKALPSNVSSSCKDFVLTRASYNACITDNKNSPDFYGSEWRVYLGKDTDLWGDHDTIKFYDKSNDLIGTYSY